MNEKRIVCWIGDAPNHRALVNKIAKEFDVVGIVLDKKRSAGTSKNSVSILKKIFDKIRFRKIDRAWAFIQQHYQQKYPDLPSVEILQTGFINSEETVSFTQSLNPDLVIVSGTSLIKEPLVTIPLLVGIMNLHTGLSPYVKGGPNCTNWCIANNEWSLIGNTILWLSSGIDSGNIITSERTDVSNCKRLPDIHFKVMEHAHDLYLRAVRYIVNSNTPYQSISQKTLGKGNLFLNKMWTTEKKIELLRNLKSVRNTQLPPDIKTVTLPYP